MDISLNQTNGLRAGSMINRLIKQIPAVQPLVITIKMFLNQRSMNEVYTGGLGSYALVCMVVSFLQVMFLLLIRLNLNLHFVIDASKDSCRRNKPYAKFGRVIDGIL